MKEMQKMKNENPVFWFLNASLWNEETLDFSSV